MLTLPPAVPLYVATQPVDVRKSFDGLSLYVQSALRLSPLSGHLFVFFNPDDQRGKMGFVGRLHALCLRIDPPSLLSILL